MVGSLAKRLVLLFGMLVTTILFSLVALSTSFVQTHLISWGFGTLQKEFGIVGQAARIDLDLSRLAVRIEELSLATAKHRNQPFFTVDEATIDFPWSILWDEFSLQAVELFRPRINVLAAEDGAFNLPVTAETESVSPEASIQLSIGALNIHDLTVNWRNDDVQMQLAAASSIMTNSGTTIRGPLQINGPSVVELNGERIELASAVGDLAFDGTTLELDRFMVRVPEGTITADGYVRDVLTVPTFDLTIVGVVDLSKLALRAGRIASGSLKISAQIDGPASDLSTTIALASEHAQWDTFTTSAVEGRIRVTPTTTTIDSFTALVAGGRLSAEGSVATDKNATSTLHLEWHDIHTDRLLETLPWEVPIAIESIMSGRLEANWNGVNLHTVALDARNLVREGDRVGETHLRMVNGHLTSISRSLGPRGHGVRSTFRCLGSLGATP